MEKSLRVDSHTLIMVEKSNALEKKSAKIPLNEQIADIALKVLITVSVAGGGIGAFLSLFKDDNAPF
jgi:hypothetical protein